MPPAPEWLKLEWSRYRLEVGYYTLTDVNRIVRWNSGTA